MARGDRFFGGGRGSGGSSDQNRDGVDDDYDRAPGNSSDSPEYSLKYDRRSEREYTNRLETADQIQEARILQELAGRQQDVREAAISAQNDVHFFPSVGKFIIPEENTWASHAEIVKDKNSNLFFRPDKYVYFDKIVAEKLDNPALTDPNHKDYARYEALRTNIAVLRNDIIGIYLNDGAFDPGDEKFIPAIAGIAAALGDALTNDTNAGRVFTRSLSLDVANVESVGAAEMYKYLLDVQQKPGLIGNAKGLLGKLVGLPDRSWNLPDIEKTPFSPANLVAPLPERRICLTQDEIRTVCTSPDIQQSIGGEHNQLIAISAGLVKRAHQLRKPETLEAPTREASVDEARTILRWLRNLQFGDRDMEEWLDQGTPAEQIAKADAAARLVEIYAGALKAKLAAAPAMADDALFIDASDAAGAMSMAVLAHTIKRLPADHARLKQLEQLWASSNQDWTPYQGQSVERLLDTMEIAIERASGQTVDKSPVERLVEMGNRIHTAAKKLRSLDTLERPAREESIELAREILRKLKRLNFTDKSAIELVDTGRPEDKAAFAQKISEMVDVYQNLLAEAAESNPDILSDKRIKEANDAVGGFAHTIKLMAAKEIPSSVATAQQISADITQMPEEWKSLHDRAVDRLVKSMEGGLEKAVGDISTQQQEQQQQQDEELAQQVIDNAMQQSSGSRKRRRRRSSGGKTAGLTKSAKRRNASDLNGDGVADRFQGLNLKGTDLAAVRELGGSLRAMGDQASVLAPAAMTLNDTIKPDDKGFAERGRDAKNPQSPRQRI